MPVVQGEGATTGNIWRAETKTTYNICRPIKTISATVSFLDHFTALADHGPESNETNFTRVLQGTTIVFV